MSMVYVVAVSGGVDSVSLLHMLVNKVYVLSGGEEPSFVVAHFDHGIRGVESRRDREFVQSLAAHYGLPFEHAEGKLGPHASEDAARVARYAFLRKVQSKHKAAAIVLAHHRDDVIETAILNILRGTYRKGLSSLRQTSELRRPLLEHSKQDILQYAKDNQLLWREDNSNTNTALARNYVRHMVIPTAVAQNRRFLDQFSILLSNAQKTNDLIDTDVAIVAAKLGDESENGYILRRHDFIMLPAAVSKEVLLWFLQKADSSSSVSRRTLANAVIFCKTAKPGKSFRISKSTELHVTKQSILIQNI